MCWFAIQSFAVAWVTRMPKVQLQITSQSHKPMNELRFRTAQHAICWKISLETETCSGEGHHMPKSLGRSSEWTRHPCQC